MLTKNELHLVMAAFESMGGDGGSSVPLATVKKRYFPLAHPRVKEGKMAPSAARDSLDYHFGRCAAEHDGNITLDEFITYHEKITDEAFDEPVANVSLFTQRVILGLWQLGDVLAPTGIRPAFPVNEVPSGMYATTAMSLIWVERKPQTGEVVPEESKVVDVGSSVSVKVAEDQFMLRGIRDVVKPLFSRGDLPEDLQGCFAYPDEVEGMTIEFIAAQASAEQRHRDFCWERGAGQYCGIEGVISSAVDRAVLPNVLRQCVCDHDAAVARRTRWMGARPLVNPMYKKTSSVYGKDTEAECRRFNTWKAESLAGKAYGNQYHGICGKKEEEEEEGSSRGAAGSGLNM